MGKMFDELKEGLEEAIQFEKGVGNAKVQSYMFLPVKKYTGTEIRELRIKRGMTKSIFALYMGVSEKTVDAWESEKTHPSGPVFRLLDILANSETANFVNAK